MSGSPRCPPPQDQPTKREKSGGIRIADTPELLGGNTPRQQVEEEEELQPGGCGCFGGSKPKPKPRKEPNPPPPPPLTTGPESLPKAVRSGSILKRRMSAGSRACVDQTEDGIRESVKKSLEAASQYAEEQGHYVPDGDSKYQGEGATKVKK